MLIYRSQFYMFCYQIVSIAYFFSISLSKHEARDMYKRIDTLREDRIEFMISVTPHVKFVLILQCLLGLALFVAQLKWFKLAKFNHFWIATFYVT